MAITNPNITPEDGLAEGDLFELKFYAKNADGSDGNFDAFQMLVKKDGVVSTILSGSFTTGSDSDGNFALYNHICGAGINQFQFEATGNFTATALAHIKVTPKPLIAP